MQITGKVIEILDEQVVSATFKKREFVVEYCEREYPEFIKFELIQEKCPLLNQHKVGDNIEVTFSLKGRKWLNSAGQTLYFNTLQALNIQSPAKMTREQYLQATGQQPTADQQ